MSTEPMKQTEDKQGMTVRSLRVEPATAIPVVRQCVKCQWYKKGAFAWGMCHEGPASVRKNQDDWCSRFKLKE